MFKTPPVTKNLIIINVLMFAMKYVLALHGIALDDLLGLHFVLAQDFRPYQLITYMFMHANFEHIFFNMFALWMFGCVVERTWGARRYLLFYLVCGLGAGLTQELWQFGQYYIEGLYSYDYVNAGTGIIPMSKFLNSWTTIGASGACYAVMLAFGMFYPNEVLILFPIPIPLKAKYFVLVCIVIEVVSSFATNGNVAHFAHLGGMAFAYFFIRHYRRRDSGFDGWDNYRGSGGGGLLDRMRRRFNERRAEDVTEVYRPDGYDYRSRRKEEDDEVDRILEKLKKSGYESLTEEEKQKLFDRSNRDEQAH